MKRKLIRVLWSSAFFLMACQHSQVVNMKDLNENMLDLRIYQENLGDEIKSGKLQDAEWLLAGMDSILLVVGQKFTEHRKLQKEFAYYYKKDLRQPISNIRGAISKNDTTAAIGAYKLLVKKCNSCHLDHDVDKTVKE